MAAQDTSIDYRNDVDMDQRPVVKMLAYVAAIISIVSLIFAAGYNWRAVVDVANKQHEDEIEMKENYVQKTVYSGDYANTNYKLDEIFRMLEKIQTKQDAGR